MKVTLHADKVFEGAIRPRILRCDSPGFRVDSLSSDMCPYEIKERGIPHRARGQGQVTMDSECGMMCLQAKDGCGSLAARGSWEGGTEQVFPWRLCEELTLPTPWFWTSGSETLR